jgi:hypothetical protein
LRPHREGFEGAAGEVGRAGVDHRVVVSEGHAAEEVSVVVTIEGAPAAVAVLHGEDPATGAVRGGGGAAW